MFRYFLLKVLRSRNYLFWCMVFPLVIMFCMNMAFGNIYDTENSIDPIRTVLVKESGSFFAEQFAELVKSMADEGAERQLFDLSEADSAEQAKEMLLAHEAMLLFVAGEDELEVFLSDDHSMTSGIISGTVADSYRTNFRIMTDVYENAERLPEEAVNEIMDNMSKELSYTMQSKGIFSDSPNPYVWYFYSTLVMGMFFNAMTGVNLVSDLKADVSGEAMRLSVSPGGKGKMIVYAFIARLIPSLLISGIHLAVMKLVFKVPLGDDPLRLAAFVLCSDIFAIGFGVICGLVFKGNLVARENKTTGVLMASVFLSGEMISQLPGIIERNAPIINDINPATVMNMALYRLAMYNNDYDFYGNMIKLVAASVVFLVIGTVILRRERYASL